MYLAYKPGSKVFTWKDFIWFIICYLQPPPKGELVKQQIGKIIYNKRLVSRTTNP